VPDLLDDPTGDELTSEELAAAERIRPHLRRGALVAIADGAGAPLGLGRPLAHAARQVGGVRLLLGWSFRLPVRLDPVAFPDVRAIVGGYGLRRQFGGSVHYVPARLSAVPALLASVLRPDVLLAGLRPGPLGLSFGSEVGWARAAVDAGARVLAEVNIGLPAASMDPALPDVRVVSETDRPPLPLPLPVPDAVSEAIGKRVAALVPPGASVQFGPGGVGDAALRALEVPVHVDSGIVGDAVIDLEARGLLAGSPLATYLAGTPAVYEWADGRPILARVEHTHDPRRLADKTLVAINTALEIDAVGQVNVEPATARVTIPVFSDRDSKVLPIRLLTTGDPAPGFEVAAATVSPRVVTVEGDIDELDPLVSIDTAPVSIGGLSSTETFESTLVLPTGVVALDVDTVRVTIALRPVTATRTYEVGLDLVGERSDRTYSTSTDRVLITLGGSVADLDRLQGSTLLATLDVTDLELGTTSVAVSTDLPAGIALVSASPDQVAVTVSIPSAPSPAAGSTSSSASPSPGG